MEKFIEEMKEYREFLLRLIAERDARMNTLYAVVERRISQRNRCWNTVRSKSHSWIVKNNRLTDLVKA
ncbi:MAG: hypothetical protein LBH47_01040 [Christensenellaceae bacterium]|jgi:hypothetical protein|nr:hypothetical protein [Christensenellaceae bacterium]